MEQGRQRSFVRKKTSVSVKMPETASHEDAAEKVGLAHQGQMHHHARVALTYR
jgi:hypothetical protein